MNYSFEVFLKGTNKKVKVYGIHGQYFMVYNPISKMFMLNHVKNYEPINEERKKEVFIVVRYSQNEIEGCFTDKDKAENYVDKVFDNSDDIYIEKIEVEE